MESDLKSRKLSPTLLLIVCATTPDGEYTIVLKDDKQMVSSRYYRKNLDVLLKS